MPFEIGIVASDGEEGLENIPIEISTRLFSGMVAHHVNDKVVGGRRYESGREGGGEVVRVGGDGLVNFALEVADEFVQRVAVVFHTDLVGGFESVDVENVRVAVVEICVWAADRRVALVDWTSSVSRRGVSCFGEAVLTVVTVRDTLSTSKQTGCQGVGWGWATD